MMKKSKPRRGTGGLSKRIGRIWLGSRIENCVEEWDKEREGTASGPTCFVSFLFIPFVKGDSYPELCAQRTNEGEGFL
jgi:hypothetical protein